jgi:hypothetical protein
MMVIMSWLSQFHHRTLEHVVVVPVRCQYFEEEVDDDERLDNVVVIQ